MDTLQDIRNSKKYSKHAKLHKSILRSPGQSLGLAISSPEPAIPLYCVGETEAQRPSLFYGTERNGTESVVALFYGTERN